MKRNDGGEATKIYFNLSERFSNPQMGDFFFVLLLFVSLKLAFRARPESGIFVASKLKIQTRNIFDCARWNRGENIFAGIYVQGLKEALNV